MRAGDGRGVAPAGRPSVVVSVGTGAYVETLGVAGWPEATHALPVAAVGDEDRVGERCFAERDS